MSEEIAIDHSEIISTIFENENKTSWAYFFPFVFSNHLPPGKKIYIYENSDLIFLFIHYLRNPNQIELFFPPLILNDLTIKQFSEIFKTNSSSEKSQPSETSEPSGTLSIKLENNMKCVLR